MEKLQKSELKFVGELRVHHEGYGFVVPTTPGPPDVFVPARGIGDALHGDLVEVCARKNRKDLYDGEILRIIERRLKQIIGRLEKKGNQWIVLREDQRVHQSVLVSILKGLQVLDWDWVVVEITEYPKGREPMRGTVIRKLPPRGTLKAEIEYVIEKHQLPLEFPREVLEEADRVSSRGLGVSTSERSQAPFVMKIASIFANFPL